MQKYPEFMEVLMQILSINELFSIDLTVTELQHGWAVNYQTITSRLTR
jgi:hypothetical protein